MTNPVIVSGLDLESLLERRLAKKQTTALSQDRQLAAFGHVINGSHREPTEASGSRSTCNQIVSERHLSPKQKNKVVLLLPSPLTPRKAEEKGYSFGGEVRWS